MRRKNPRAQKKVQRSGAAKSTSNAKALKSMAML
jgi:hypothetical protein